MAEPTVIKLTKQVQTVLVIGIDDGEDSVVRLTRPDFSDMPQKDIIIESTDDVYVEFDGPCYAGPGSGIGTASMVVSANSPRTLSNVRSKDIHLLAVGSGSPDAQITIVQKDKTRVG